jgi:tRNA A64-2'-O-ribosylphosphate transferase
LHVPAKKAKVSRTDLMKALPRCIDFTRRTLGTPGARLCVTCDDGVDHSVAVAVALCIAMGPSSSSSVDKDEVRKRLALVAKTHPDARPTRASLKQVYNFFLHSNNAVAD